MSHRVRAFLSTVIAVFLLITIPSLLDFSDPAIAHFNHTVADATVLTELPGNEFSSVAFIPFSLEPLQNLINQINRQITESNQGNLLSRIIYQLILALTLIVAWKLLNVLHKRSLAKLRSLNWENYHLKIQHLELIPSNRILGVASIGLKVIHVILKLCLLYISIPILLNFFPQTQETADTIISSTVDVLTEILISFLAYLPKLLILTGIIAIAYYVNRLIKKIFTEVQKGNLSLPGFYPEWVQPTYNLSRILLTLFTITVSYPFLPGGFESPVFRGIAIFGAVLGAIGAREAVSDIISGIILIYSRSFLEGDRVITDDIKGTVLEKSLLVTRIRTSKNVIITIPNSTLRSSVIFNFTASMREHDNHLVIHVKITLGYDLPWRKVHEVLKKAAEMTKNVIEEPAPFVLQTSMNDYHITYELNAYTDQPKSLERTYSELYQNIQDCCKEAKIEILSPSYLAVRDGNESTIPAN
jgi:small-conductance mechanosensitive channel